MLSYVSASIQKALVGLVHLWLASGSLEHSGRLPEWAVFYVYPNSVEHLPRGKRVLVTFEVVDDGPTG